MIGRSVALFGRRAPVATVAAVLVIVAGAAALSIVATRKEARPRLHVSTIDVGDAPQALSHGPEGLWVVLGGDAAVKSIDVSDGTVGPLVELDVVPGGVAVGDGSVWVGSIQGSAIKRVHQNRRVGIPRVTNVPVGQTPQSVALGESGLWVAAFDDGSLWRVDPDSGEVSGEPIDLDDGFPSALALGFGSVWVTDVVDNTLLRLDESTGELQETIPVGDSPTGIAVGEGGVWVTNFGDATVTHIDPGTDSAVGTAILVGGKPGGIATGLGYVWVTRPEDDSLIRIDPEESEWTGEVFDVGDGPQGVTVAAGSVWVADQGSDTVTKLTPEE